MVSCDVIIPYHKENLRWVSISVDSILNQVKANCIIHLVSDGRMEDSSLVKSYLHNPNVRLYLNKEPIGPYRTVNRLFNRLETDYIAIQDSDDIAMPNRIALSIETMKKDGSEMFGANMMQFASYESVNSFSLNKIKNIPIHKSFFNDGWENSPYCVVVNGTRVVKRKTFERMNGFAPYLMSSDCEFTTRSYLAGVKISILEDIVALRRVHGASLSHSSKYGMGSDFREKCHKSMIESYKEMVGDFDPAKYGGMKEDLKEEGSTCRIIGPK